MATKAKKNLHDGHRGRVRESAEKDPELESFSDFQTLEFLLGFFIPRKNTSVLAHELIDQFGTFFGVLCATPEELFQAKNMTGTAANFLPNMLSIVRRAEVSRTKRYSTVTTVGEAVAAFRPYFTCRNLELFYVMMLDINDRIISIDMLSKGKANYTTVDFESITLKASRTQAVKLILAHNHPGGNLFPSKDDLKMTSVISHLMLSMGREVVDHIIFAGDEYYSFYEKKHMDELIEKADLVFGLNRSKEVHSRKHAYQYIQESGDGAADRPPIDFANFDLSSFDVTEMITSFEELDRLMPKTRSDNPSATTYAPSKYAVTKPAKPAKAASPKAKATTQNVEEVAAKTEKVTAKSDEGLTEKAEKAAAKVDEIYVDKTDKTETKPVIIDENDIFA